MGPKTDVTKYYLIVGRDKKGLAEKIRKKARELFKITSLELRISGGGDGDLHEEIAEWNSFRASQDEYFQLYTVIDSNTEGYAECISVICQLPLNENYHKEVEQFLEFVLKYPFVSNHTPLKKRPQGYKSFFGYLDDFYYPTASKPFVTEKGQGE